MAANISFLKPDDTMLAPAMLVMLHGMGMAGSRPFEDFVSACCGTSKDWLQKVFPKAVPRASMPDVPCDRWFDMNSMPVRPDDEHNGLSEAVEVVHDILQKAEADGIPSSRIIVGGFSQGAVVALVAGLTYKTPVAGICMFSGWLPSVQLEGVRHWDTPILMCHGSNDTLIPKSTADYSAQMLRDAGASSVEFTSLPNAKHEFGIAWHEESLKRFVGNKLPAIQGREHTMSETTYASSDPSMDGASDEDDDVDVQELPDVGVAETCTVEHCVLQ